MQNSEKKPLLSFVLITYKQEKFVKEAVEGALSQTYSPLEIIISDDCSPDRTFEIIQEMVASYHGPHKVILNHNDTNMGLMAHVNHVTQKYVHGEWIVMAAGDDVSLPNRVSDFYREITKHPDVAVAYSGLRGIDANGKRVEFGSFRRKTMRQALQLLADIPIGSGCAAIYRKDIFQEFPSPSEVVEIEDVILSSRALLLGDFLNIDDIGVLYRSHENNLSLFSGSKQTIRQKSHKLQLSVLGSNIQQLIDLFIYEKKHPEKYLLIQKMRKRILRSMQKKQLSYDWYYYPQHHAYQLRNMVLNPLAYQLFINMLFTRFLRFFH